MSDIKTQEEMFRKLVARCAAKECCVSEAQEKLRNWNVGRIEEAEIISRLVQEGYIDEARYCRAFIHDQLRFAGWGRIKIGYTLRQKQIDSLTISQAMQQVVDEEEYRKSLHKILVAKMRGLKSLPAHVQSDKLMRFALSRGFEPELIRTLLKELSLECEVGLEI